MARERPDIQPPLPTIHYPPFTKEPYNARMSSEGTKKESPWLMILGIAMIIVFAVNAIRSGRFWGFADQFTQMGMACAGWLGTIESRQHVVRLLMVIIFLGLVGLISQVYRQNDEDFAPGWLAFSFVVSSLVLWIRYRAFERLERKPVSD